VDALLQLLHRHVLRLAVMIELEQRRQSRITIK
jgi:hypothetical protein